MTKAEVVAHSINPWGQELVSVLATFPRIILAEVNTHRMLSKNTSSSRAIPFFKMLEVVYNNPFIPIAWQTHHSGMQGSEYIDCNEIISVPKFADDFIELIRKQAVEDKFKVTDEFELVLSNIKVSFGTMFGQYSKFTVKDLWLKTRDMICTAASVMYTIGKVSKQICNRLLEPFMWTTMLITGNLDDLAWGNFFKLRCPSYEFGKLTDTPKVWKSKRDAIYDFPDWKDNTDLFWLSMNTGQAEIHMMQLAECIYDAIQDSTPEQLTAGQWHIPFKDKIVFDGLLERALYDHVEIHVGDFKNPRIRYSVPSKVKISTSMGARTSYTVVGGELKLDYKNLISLHDRLIAQAPPHSSPMEHCAMVPDAEDYETNVRGKLEWTGGQYDKLLPTDGVDGWFRNFRGFIPYRYIIEANA